MLTFVIGLAVGIITTVAMYKTDKRKPPKR